MDYRRVLLVISLVFNGVLLILLLHLQVKFVSSGLEVLSANALSNESVSAQNLNRPRSRYSSHRCLGGSFEAGDKTRSCELLNVCFVRGTFEYYISSKVEKKTRFGSVHNVAQGLFADADFSVPWVLAHVTSRNDREYYNEPRDFVMTSVSDRGPPTNAEWIDVGIPFKRILASNFGHAMGEFGIPIFIMMRAFGYTGSENWQHFVLDDCWSNNDMIIAFPSTNYHRGLCDKITQDLMGLLSNRAVRPLHPTLSSGKPNKTPVCFRRMLIGFRHLNVLMASDTDGAKGFFFRQYRDIVLTRLKIVPVDDGVFRIIISLKLGKGLSYNSRDIGNGEELAAELRKTDFGTPTEVKVVSLAGMDIREQIRLISSSNLWFTPSGATSFMAPFLSDSSTLVVLPYCSNGPINSTTGIRDLTCKGSFCCYSAPMDNFFFNQIPAQVDWYPVQIPEEIMGACSRLDVLRTFDCHVRVNFEKFKTIVRRAMFRRSEVIKAHTM